MARNGSGTYAKVNTFSAGATITAAGHNQNWDDVAAEITNSVAVDGQSTMSGPLKLATGTAGSPSQTFGSDTDTGRYRKSANTMADVCNGAEVQEISTTGVAVTGTHTVSGTQTVTGLSAGIGHVPIGAVMSWGGTTAPTGWIFAAGQNLNRVTNAALFAIYSTGYGSGDGSTTFGIPDGRGRSIFGRGDMGGSDAGRLTSFTIVPAPTTLGATGGAQSTTILQGHLPAVSLNPNTASQTLSHPLGGGTAIAPNSGSAGSGVQSVGATTIFNTGTYTALADHTVTFPTVALGGSGSALDKMPPAIILNTIIFAGV